MPPPPPPPSKTFRVLNSSNAGTSTELVASMSVTVRWTRQPVNAAVHSTTAHVAATTRRERERQCESGTAALFGSLNFLLSGASVGDAGGEGGGLEIFDKEPTFCISAATNTRTEVQVGSLRGLGGRARAKAPPCIRAEMKSNTKTRETNCGIQLHVSWPVQAGRQKTRGRGPETHTHLRCVIKRNVITLCRFQAKLGIPLEGGGGAFNGQWP